MDGEAGSGGGSFVTQNLQDSVLDAGAAAAASQPQETTGAAAGAGTVAGADVAGAAQGAPEEYAAFTMPEGFQAGDPAIQEAIDGGVQLFKEANLTQAMAQKFVDFHMKQWKGAADQIEEMRRQARQSDEWIEQTKSDPVLGGVNLNANIETVKLAVDKLGGTNLRDVLNSTGAINHPAVFGAFVKMGKLMKEDRAVAGSPVMGPAGDNPSAKASLVYPNMQRK